MDSSAEPRDIGPFHILQHLGEGGMGTVYLAEQRHPVRRRVALKVLKKGMDSKAFLTRFDAERQALAMMEHSCIAKVFDAGVAKTGQPYLAMEYVKGEPITEYCDNNKLSLPERLELFRDVCSGVQHAHTKGVMHRDLKPNNVLITLQDGKPMCKIIDFGLAKAVDHRLVEATLFTEAGQVIGTPEYMSPEQAGVGGLDVDTRTDVYSLGVLLYQLLTGSLPVTREELLRNGWLEMQRMIREDEPKKPSTRITTLGPAADAHAKARRMPLVELQRSLEGDLDWIVMKALEKDRSRRYTTAQELAADLLRHLRDEPVTAGPPTAGYLLSKLFRRYRASVLTGGAVVCALAIGLVIALVQWRAATEAKDIADRKGAEAERERGVALHQQRLATEHLDNFLRLKDAVVLKDFENRAAAFVETSDSVARMEAWVREVETWLEAMPKHAEILAAMRVQAQEHAGSWTFADRGQQFLHDELAKLVAGIDAFAAPGGGLAHVKSSLGWSRRIRAITVDEPVEAWSAAVHRVRALPAYGKLALTPQEGLVPIGPDPASHLEEFWLPRSGEQPRRDATGRLAMTEASGIVLVLLPGGLATIGSDAGEPDALETETPRHQVPLRAFFLSKYEMTQGQWVRLASVDNPSRFKPPPEPMDGAPTLLHPVEGVSFRLAMDQLSRFGWTLPTEAQWEYACRAGTSGRWHFGDTKESLIGNGKCLFNAADGRLSRGDGQYMEDSDFWPELDDGWVVHAPAGSFPPNAFGLHDMHGNVAELTRGTFGGYSDPGIHHAPDDGDLVGGSPNLAVHRGGSYFKRVEAARSATRKAVARDGKYDNIGLRVARAIQ